MVSVKFCPTAGYALIGVADSRRAMRERGRTNGGKVEADASAYVEARNDGDGTACANGVIRHSEDVAISGLDRTGPNPEWCRARVAGGPCRSHHHRRSLLRIPSKEQPQRRHFLCVELNFMRSKNSILRIAPCYSTHITAKVHRCLYCKQTASDPVILWSWGCDCRL